MLTLSRPATQHKFGVYVLPLQDEVLGMPRDGEGDFDQPSFTERAAHMLPAGIRGILARRQQQKDAAVANDSIAVSILSKPGGAVTHKAHLPVFASPPPHHSPCCHDGCHHTLTPAAAGIVDIRIIVGEAANNTFDSDQWKRVRRGQRRYQKIPSDLRGNTRFATRDSLSVHVWVLTGSKRKEKIRSSLQKCHANSHTISTCVWPQVEIRCGRSESFMSALC